jgi:abequosyltransferase
MEYKLSICIPTYNRCNFLKNTLNYLLPIVIENDNIEIVISDNNSDDETYEYCNSLIKQYPFINYYKQINNIGLDFNAISSIENAKSNYCWLLSDDDIPLKNSIKKIVKCICDYNPVLIYLNYSGFTGELPKFYSIYNSNIKDEIYVENQEELLIKHLLNHFSATVVEKDTFLKYKFILNEYKKLGFIRGYILCMSDYMVLQEKKLTYFIGENLLMTRNPESIIANNYNPLSIVFEVATHFRLLRNRKLISKRTESIVVNRYLKGFYNIIIPIKITYSNYYDKKLISQLNHSCYYYKNYYFYNLPFILTPAFILKPLYNFYKKYFKK